MLDVMRVTCPVVVMMGSKPAATHMSIISKGPKEEMSSWPQVAPTLGRCSMGPRQFFLW